MEMDDQMDEKSMDTPAWVTMDGPSFFLRQRIKLNDNNVVMQFPSNKTDFGEWYVFWHELTKEKKRLTTLNTTIRCHDLDFDLRDAMPLIILFDDNYLICSSKCKLNC